MSKADADKPPYGTTSKRQAEDVLQGITLPDDVRQVLVERIATACEQAWRLGLVDAEAVDRISGLLQKGES